MLLPDFEQSRNGFVITTDKSSLDIQVIYEFLTNRSPWARNISLDVVLRAIQNSLCFGVFQQESQVGFARVVSDYATFAYLEDVFILEEYRGKGLAKWLIECIVNYPYLTSLRRFALATRDAHELYAKYGFKPLSKPETFMEIYRPNIYHET